MALLIKTFLAPSKIEGIGLFAGEFVKKNTITWEYNDVIDRKYTDEFVNKQPLLIKRFILHYGYFDIRVNMHIMCGDNARFMNHSDNPNTIGDYSATKQKEGIDIAVRDIHVNEELTCDYSTFDNNFDTKIKTGHSPPLKIGRIEI